MSKKCRILFFMIIIKILVLINFNVSYALSPISEPIYEGIDVSNWQGYINYRLVKDSGIDIVYIKASEGTTFKDPYFEYNYRNAKENGLKVGFYHFLTATNVEQAKNQAQFFASVISGKAPDCKLAMDFEQFRNGITVKEINDISLAFMQSLRELTGKEIIVYSNLNDAQRVFNRNVSSQYPLWLAYWGNYSALENVQSSWDKWEGVQYTNMGTIAGVDGYVDRNRFTRNVLLEKCTDCPIIEPPNGDESKEINYTVKRGDTLWAISQRYGVTVKELAEINNIANPNLIYPGQVLKILVDSEIDHNDVIDMGHVLYTVKRGDNLWNISRRYNTTVQLIVQMNNIKNPNLIYPGQVFKILTNNYSNFNSGFTYVVKRGDNLWNISRRFGFTVNYLVKLNNIKNPNLIYPGQIIKIK